MPLPDWARAWGAPLCAATIRATHEDFFVDEELGIEPSGDGAHDLLHVEKTGANTEWVARQLARHAGVPVGDVGYSGLKDRHAVTRQWFSVPHHGNTRWDELSVDGVTLLRAVRHARKLRRGSHQRNRFRIVLRGCPGGDFGERLQCIATGGVPNYFGEQRFGRDGGNLELAGAWAKGRRLPRTKRSLAISTARSWLFNQALDSRVRDGTWNRLLDGDVVNLDGTGSVFVAEQVDADLDTRCNALDLHPAGLLAGEGADAQHEWSEALIEARVKAAYRSLRLPVQELNWSLDGEALTLEFSLRRGGFATAVLREIADITDARHR